MARATTHWYTVCDDIAKAFNTYYSRNREFSGEMLFTSLSDNKLFLRNNSWVDDIKISTYRSLDPLQLFASFGRKGLSTSRRGYIRLL